MSKFSTENLTDTFFVATKHVFCRTVNGNGEGGGGGGNVNGNGGGGGGGLSTVMGAGCVGREKRIHMFPSAP